MKPFRMLNIATVISISLAGVVGCSSGDDDESTENASVSSKPADSRPDEREPTAGNNTNDAEPAVLEGRVTFQGPLPQLREIVATKDVEYCGQHVGPRPEVVVSDSRELSGVVIEIRGLQEPEGGWAWEHPEEGYVLRQKGCAFEPYLLVMPNRHDLTVFNDDPVSHNVNTGQWNILQAAGAEPLVRTVSGRRSIRVGCNIHSWMESWIYLAQSPYYAVTGDNGGFRIEGVPPGKCRVTAWHPSLRALRKSIELPPAGSIQQGFVFESPYKG